MNEKYLAVLSAIANSSRNFSEIKDTTGVGIGELEDIIADLKALNCIQATDAGYITTVRAEEFILKPRILGYCVVRSDGCYLLGYDNNLALWTPDANWKYRFDSQTTAQTVAAAISSRTKHSCEVVAIGRLEMA